MSFVDYFLSWMMQNFNRLIANLKLEGYSDQAVADALDRSRATVTRKLPLVRQIWRSEAMDTTGVTSPAE
jgi:hypothetical protein